MKEFIRQLSQAFPDYYIVLVIDNAIWHKTKVLEVPNNIGFAFIPPYTPEMNLIEQVCVELRKQSFENKVFKTWKDVMNQLQYVIKRLH